MKRKRKPSIGSSKQELTDYIKVLEGTIRTLNKRKESIETLTNAQVRMSRLLIDFNERLSRLEAVFNNMTEDVDGWRRDYSIKDIE